MRPNRTQSPASTALPNGTNCSSTAADADADAGRSWAPPPLPPSPPPPAVVAIFFSLPACTYTRFAQRLDSGDSATDSAIGRHSRVAAVPLAVPGGCLLSALHGGHRVTYCRE